MPDENESLHRCYEVENAAGEHIGYWRDKATAEALAVQHEGEARELNPPDRIRCEDDAD